MMVPVTFTDDAMSYDRYAFFQWDYGQKVEVHGLTLQATVEVHFARKDVPAIVMLGETTGGVMTVSVPDSVLQFSGDMTMYIYVATPTLAYTYKAVPFTVRKREKPMDYVEQVQPGITAQLVNKLNSIIGTGIASYIPDVNAVNQMIQDYVSGNMIANNLATIAAGLALDARQGKVLNDLITAQNDNLANYKIVIFNTSVTLSTTAINITLAGQIAYGNVITMMINYNGYTLPVTFCVATYMRIPISSTDYITIELVDSVTLKFTVTGTGTWQLYRIVRLA